ncbi:MAG: diphosphate--fructose-6-phosphate 1-phosphotransferase [Dehalococcoidia bacterium]
MSSGSKGNVLVMQSGGCTPVINRSLTGVAQEAFQHREFGKVYGAAHGLEGVLRQEFLDLSQLSKADWGRVARTPGAALGSTRHKLQTEEIPVILEALCRHEIRYLFTIGGNDSAETGHGVGLTARDAGYDLTVMNVPKTIDNDLVLTDHSPGYGSAARFVALSAIGAGQDARSMGKASPITIIEVMGRDTGWLAAAAALARQREGDAPHVICVPEVPIEEDHFIDCIEAAYRRYGFAVAVIAENTRGPEGVLGGDQEPWWVDDFGHAYYEEPGRYLSELVTRQLNVRARYEKPGTVQRSFMEALSRSDVREAEMAGRAAVKYALEGQTDQIVTLVREPGRRYVCTTGLAPLEQVAGQVQTMPEHYLDPVSSYVTDEFLEYLRPLVGAPLPRYHSIV